MTGMGTHSAAKGGPLRRAWICAWIVTVAMGGTTMAFQVYHSLTTGHMPWPYAWLFGIMPLLLAMVILEIVAEWTAASWRAKGVAYAVMVGAMYMSASGTGDVVRYAAPPHCQLLFGALLDTAELFAANFIMNGPRAADAAADAAAAAVAAREAVLRAEANAERSARQEAEANAAARTAELRAELEGERDARAAEAAGAEAELRAAAVRADSGARAERQAALDAAREAHEARERGLADELAAERRRRETAEQDAAMRARAEAGRITAEAGRSAVITELNTARTALEAALADRGDAESRAERAEAKAASAERRLAANAEANGTRKTGAAGERKAPRAVVPSDVDARAEALAIIAAEPNITGAELGERLGMSDRWGQLRKKEYAGHVTGSGGEAAAPGEGE